jgi:hypothetical protein
MKAYVRILALICAIMMLVPALASCADTNGEDVVTTEAAETEAEISVEEQNADA